MGIFDDILNGAPAEDMAVINKYPQLKQSVENLESNLGEVARYANGWLQWQQDNWDDQSKMTRQEKELAAQLATAQSRLSSASASGADAATISTLRTDMEAKLADVQKQSSLQLEGMNYFYREVSKRLFPHQKEFGEVLDSDALMKYMRDNHISDASLAYDRMVAPKRAELTVAGEKAREEKHAAELKEAEERGAARKATELAMGPSGSLPTDGSGGIAGVTAPIGKPIQISDEMKAKLADSKLGDGSLARLGYEQFVRGELPMQQ